MGSFGNVPKSALMSEPTKEENANELRLPLNAFRKCSSALLAACQSDFDWAKRLIEMLISSEDRLGSDAARLVNGFKSSGNFDTVVSSMRLWRQGPTLSEAQRDLRKWVNERVSVWSCIMRLISCRLRHDFTAWLAALRISALGSDVSSSLAVEVDVARLMPFFILVSIMDTLCSRECDS